MPVRSSDTSVLKWPDLATVQPAVRRWARRLAAARPEVTAVGYFGSYARGDWGVGSDLDLVIIVAHSPRPFEERAVDFDPREIPVPVDILVYTEKEWREARDEPFFRRLAREAVWMYGGQ